MSSKTFLCVSMCFSTYSSFISCHSTYSNKMKYIIENERLHLTKNATYMIKKTILSNSISHFSCSIRNKMFVIAAVFTVGINTEDVASLSLDETTPLRISLCWANFSSFIHFNIQPFLSLLNPDVVCARCLVLRPFWSHRRSSCAVLAQLYPIVRRTRFPPSERI